MIRFAEYVRHLGRPLARPESEAERTKEDGAATDDTNDADTTVRRLKQRIASLEKRVRTLESRPLPLKLDEVLTSMGQRLKGDNPNGVYMNERFRNFEIALFNIKQLGYELASQLAKEKLYRHVDGPLDIRLTSSLCTQKDIESDWFSFWCREMAMAPMYHRKLWELTYIAQALWSEGKLDTDASGLGFGCGLEPLPSLFAKYGATVLATDLDPTRPEAAGWQRTSQHAATADALRNRSICPDEKRLANIDFRPIDMNAIPDDLHGKFDFCWSACALEHVGSIAKGTEFILNSLKTLRSGGVAVHTTEFNLEGGPTIDNWPTVLFQKEHIDEVLRRAEEMGCTARPLDVSAGDGILDGLVDVPPWSHAVLGKRGMPHLKLSVDGFVCTSVGIIIRKL